MRRRLFSAAAAILAMSSIVMTQSSAAQLSLRGGQRAHYSSLQRCDAAVDAATPTTSGQSISVQVAGIDEACGGLGLSIVVYDPATDAQRSSGSGFVVVGGGSQSFTVTAYTPSATDKVSVTVDSWPVATTWTYTPPPTTSCVALSSSGTPQPGGSCTITGLSFSAPWDSLGNRQTNGHVNVTSSSAYISFSVDLRAALPVDWNWSTSGTLSRSHYIPTPGYACSSLPMLTGTTNPGWGRIDLYIELVENRAGKTVNCAG